MLVIRSDQMEMFQQEALRSFENEMIAHLAKLSPPLFKAIGEKQMRQAIQFGRNRAEIYGFTLRGPVRLYLELMLLFGSHLDTDPQYPWLTKILTDLNSGLQMQRAERLYEATMDYWQKVVGEERIYLLKGLRNIQMMIREPSDLSLQDFIPAVQRRITCIYPQKVAYVGDHTLEAVIQRGIGGARRQGFTSGRGATLVILLMFALGHGCGTDPLYPWIAQTLRNEVLATPEAKAQHLEKQFMTWLEHRLAPVEKDVQP